MSNVNRWGIVVAWFMFLAIFYTALSPILDGLYRAFYPFIDSGGQEVVDLYVRIGVYGLQLMMSVGLVLWAALPRREERVSRVVRRQFR